MWYVKSIVQICNKGHCSSKATVALYNSRNELFGYYCRKCGAREVKVRLAEDRRRSKKGLPV